MEIKEFLRSHPLISPHSVEKICNLPNNTLCLSKNRSIPDKYLASIISLLKDYGLDDEVLSPDLKVSASIDQDTKIYESLKTREGCILRYYEGFWKRIDVPDGTKFILKP